MLKNEENIAQSNSREMLHFSEAVLYGYLWYFRCMLFLILMTCSVVQLKLMGCFFRLMWMEMEQSITLSL
jgi:hypothetical protein